MTGGAKMLIITSDEDIIREFSTKKLKNTQIIDLDVHKQISIGDQEQKNSFLTQLPSHNFDLHPKHDDKSNKILRKPIDLFCAVCGAHAIGFNYDALSCGSCKAFFVRNAARSLETIKCLTEHGQCSISHSSRPKCKQCRLRRCFDVGMKKELIRNKEKRRRRRRKYLGKYRIISSEYILTSESPSQTIDRFPTPMEESSDILEEKKKISSNEFFSNDEWMKIENMRRNFSMIFNDDEEHCLYENLSDRMSALISWSKFVGQTALIFIRFYRQIPEFEYLNNDDRFILIKNNLFSLYLLSKSFLDHHQIDDKQKQFYHLCFGSNSIYDTLMNLRHSINQITKQDPIYFSLILTIIIFSHCLSINDEQTLLKDLLAVNRAQSFYTKLLWNYLRKHHDEEHACLHFMKLVNIIIRMEALGKNIREFFRIQLITSYNIDKVTSLMQSLPFIP